MNSFYAAGYRDAFEKLAVSSAMAQRALLNRTSKGMYPQQVSRLVGSNPRTFARAGMEQPTRQMLNESGMEGLYKSKAQFDAAAAMQKAKRNPNPVPADWDEGVPRF